MKAKKIFIYIFLILVCLWAVFPLYYMFCLASGSPSGSLIPGNELLSNIRYILFETRFLDSFFFTLKYTVIQTVITLLICSMAGYGFEVFHDKVKDKLFQVILYSMMIPFVSTIVPLFIMIMRAGLYDTMWGLILPYLSSPLIIMIFRQNARSFPVALREAARMDGMNEFGIFFRIFLPTMKSALSCGIIIAFLNAWNTYQWPRIIMSNQTHIPMTVYIQLQDIGNPMAVVMLNMIPSMVVFFIFQKFFIEGMGGSIK